MNILFVTPRIPYPLDTGGKIRTFNLLKQVKLQGNNVVLLSFQFGEELAGVKNIFDGLGIDVVVVPGQDSVSVKTIIFAIAKGLPLSVAKYRSREMATAIIKTVREKKIDVVHFDHVHMGQYLEFCPGIPVVIDEHNVECLILSRLAKNTGNPLKKCLYAFEAGKMKDLEKRLCSKASRVFFVSEEDRQNYGKFGARLNNAEVIPNGVDTEYFRSSVVGHHSSEEALVFTGSMDWLPNSDAVEYFCREILPLVWHENPGVIFYVVGKNPSEAIKKLGEADRHVIVTGSVPDVRPYVERSKVFVVPLRIGGGTRLKILEALAMEKAVVSTTIGAEGIDVRNSEHIVLADAPEGFAQKVVALLKNDEERKKVGENGRRLVHEQYDWKIIGARLNRAYLGYKNED